MWDRLNGYSMSKQMMILSGGSTGTFLLLAAIVAIAVVTGTNNTMKINSEKALDDQILRTSSQTIDTTGKLVRETLLTSYEGNIQVVAQAMRDTYRSDYSMIHGAEESVFEYGNASLVSQGLTLTSDSRQTKMANFTSTTYYVPGMTLADVPTFSARINRTRDRAKHIDQFSRKLYQLYPAFVAIYMGFADDGVFVSMPAIGTLDTDPTRSYDPRNRGWYQSTHDRHRYQSARDHRPVIITKPYQDFNDKGWMITIAAPIYDTANNFVGVVGGDMLISALKEIIDDINFLETGKVTLLDGKQVVTDRDWAADPTNSRVFEYSDLTTPKIPESLWGDIASIGAGDTKNFTETVDVSGKNEKEEYLFIARRLEDSGLGLSRYVLLVSVPRAEISEPITKIIDEMVSVNTTIGLSYSFGVIVFGFFIFAVIIWVGRVITRSVGKAQRNIEAIAKRLGHTSKAIFDIDDDDASREGFEEIDEFKQAGTTMLHNLHARQEEENAARTVNVGSEWHNPHALPVPAQMPNWEQFASQTPSAPPPDYNSDSDDNGASVLPPNMQAVICDFNSALPPPPSYDEAIGRDLSSAYHTVLSANAGAGNGNGHKHKGGKHRKRSARAESSSSDSSTDSSASTASTTMITASSSSSSYDSSSSSSSDSSSS